MSNLKLSEAKYKKSILIFSIISLIISIFSIILKFNFFILPSALLLVYALIYGKAKGKENFCILGIFATLSLQALLLLISFVFNFRGLLYNTTPMFALMLSASMITVTVRLCMGKKSKPHIIIAVLCGFMMSAIDSVRFASDSFFNTFMLYIIFLGEVILYSALIIIIFLNKNIESSMAINNLSKKESKNVDNVSQILQKELLLLNEKYELGILTEEEYQEARIKLLSKL